MLPALHRMMKKILKTLSLRKPSNINGYSKDDFKKALVDLQYHVENQDIEFEKLNRKQGSTEIRIDEDFDAGIIVIADSAFAAAQEAVLDILPVGANNATIECNELSYYGPVQ
jgi:hypothetical protein